MSGFSGDSSLLYHRHSPSALLTAQVINEQPRLVSPNLPVEPCHLDVTELPQSPETDAIRGRIPLFASDTVSVCWAVAEHSSELYRNAAGDELVFVHKGSLVLESVFGTMPVHSGDYVVVPAGMTHRWAIAEGLTAELLILEARGHVGPPRRYLSAGGQFLEGTPYCERDIRAPAEPYLAEDAPTGVLVRTRAGLSRHTYEHNPFDVVGWDGCVYPWALSINDFEPTVGSLHLPPPVHQTFEGPGFVVCSFVPRPYDFHPDAVKVPYHHANVDSDELLFYVDGDFMSRSGSGIRPGSITLHPSGFVHGPQPGSWERSIDADRTGEVAVMIDTFEPLRITDVARAAADPAYKTTWRG